MAEPDLRMAMILPSFRINVNRLVELQESAIAARSHNNANICVVGSRTMDIDNIKRIVLKFLDTNFSEEERHKRRIAKINTSTH